MLRCLVIVAFLLVIGCADTNNAVPASGVGQRIPLPAHEPSDLTEYVLNGTDTELRSGGAVDAGSALILDGTSSGFEYGVYRFNPGLDAPDSVSVLLEEPATTGAWIGLANYTTGHWEFSGPFVKQKTLVVDDPAFISPAGNIWVAVLTANESATVNALSVRTIKPANEAPLAAFITDVAGGNAPLTVQFDASGSSDSDGSIIEYAWDFDGDGLYEGFTDTPLATHIFTSPGLFQVKLRVTDDQFARATTTTEINVNAVGNALPQASVMATPNDGESPYFVDLDASASLDTDGAIVVYDWDFENDGIWDAYNAGPTINHQYSVVGVTDAVVRVTDNEGAQDMAVTQITVHGWLPGQTIGDTSSFNCYCSLAVVDGVPAIAYHDGNLQDLMFKKASDPFGDSWNIPQSIDSGGNVGQHTSMAIVNGNPAIAYNDGTNAHPKYIRASDIDGVNWNTPLTVDSAGVAGVFISLAVVNGNPAVSYYTFSGNDIKYVRATDQDGTAWGTPVIVDSTGDVGQYTSLAVVNGKPAISYYDATNGDLRFVRATDLDGASWGVPTTVESTGNVGQSTSLEVVNGWPAISYQDAGNLDLKYVRALDPDGIAWDLPLTLDTVNNAGSYSSLAIVGGNPAIAYAYFDPMSNADLKYISALDPDGASWFMPQFLDTVASVGYFASLAEINGTAMVAYEDYTNQDLKFVKRF